MQNKVYLDKQDIIIIEVVGEQTLGSVETMGRQINMLITDLKSRGKPVLGIDDVQRIGKVASDARKLVVQLAQTLDYDRVAMVGKGGIMRLGANLMLRATGKTYRLRYFDNREAAFTWLREKQLP